MFTPSIVDFWGVLVLFRDGDRSVSSYASLATGPAPTYGSRNDPALSRGGVHNDQANQIRDDREGSSYEHRCGRGGGRGRGRSSFRRNGDPAGRLGGGGGGSDRLSNSEPFSSVADNRPMVPASPNSGYESGEISLSPKPVAYSRHDYQSDRYDNDRVRLRSRDRDEVRRYGDSDFRGGRRGSDLSDERPPSEGRGSGRGGRFSVRGGRARGRFGKAGRSDFSGRGRSLDGGSNFRDRDSTRDEDLLSSDREVPPRERESVLRDRDLIPKERECTPRDKNLPPREREFIQRDGDLSIREREFIQRDRDLPPREREFIPRERDLRLREKEFIPRDRDLPPRERDLPRKEGELSSRHVDSTPRERVVSLRDRDLSRRERDLAPRDITLRDGPRDMSMRNAAASDMQLRDRPFWEGSIESQRSRIEDRYETKPTLGIKSYSSILDETESRLAHASEDRFAKRRRDDTSNRQTDHDDKRARPIDTGPRGRPVCTNDFPRDGQRVHSRDSFPEPTFHHRDRVPLRSNPPSVKDDRDSRAQKAEFNDESKGGPAIREFREGRPFFKPRVDAERLDSGLPVRKSVYHDEPPPSPYAQPHRRLDLKSDFERDFPAPDFHARKIDNDRRPSPKPFVEEPRRPAESRNRSPIPATMSSRPPGAVEDDHVRPHDGLPSFEMLSFSGRSGRGRGFRDRVDRSVRGRGGRGRPDFGRGLPPSSWDGSERDVTPYNQKVPSNSWNRREDEPPLSSYAQPSEPRVGGYASLADQVPSFAAMAENSKSSGKETVKSETSDDVPAGPRPLTPPPVGTPSGVMKAVTRLAELEASMEYTFAKHMLLVKKRKQLQAQHKVLEKLPVGIEAIQEDLEKLQTAGFVELSI
jgi:hypothetical protein